MALEQFQTLYDKVKALVQDSQRSARKHVNHLMVLTYWSIGEIICEDELQEQVRAKYGDEVIKTLSERLTNEFGKGFDERNLRNMKQFYRVFPIWNSVSTELTWTHYRHLFLTARVFRF